MWPVLVSGCPPAQAVAIFQSRKRQVYIRLSANSLPVEPHHVPRRKGLPASSRMLPTIGCAARSAFSAASSA